MYDAESVFKLSAPPCEGEPANQSRQTGRACSVLWPAISQDTASRSTGSGICCRKVQFFPPQRSAPGRPGGGFSLRALVPRTRASTSSLACQTQIPSPTGRGQGSAAQILPSPTGREWASGMRERALLGPARALQRPESCPLLKSYFGHLCLHDHTAKPNRTRGRRRRRQRRRAGDGRGGGRTEGRNTGRMGARTHGRREGGMDGGTKGRRGGMTEGRSGGRTEGRRDESTEGTLEERMEGWMGSKDGLT